MPEFYYVLVLAFILVLGGVFFLFFHFTQKIRNNMQQDLMQLAQSQNNNQNTLQIQLNQRIQSQEQHLTETLYQKFDILNQKIQGTLEKNTNQTTENLSSLRERLSVIDAAQKKISDLSSQVVSLQDILSNKQARGAFGEVQLQDLVTSILPPSAYEFQKTLSNGKRVDCFLLLPNPPGSIGVDAKFPLESYRSLVGTQNIQEKETYGRLFKSDMLKHINAIAEKYIIQGETALSALLFLPSESIYAEIHTNFPEIIRASFEAKVWIVSPTTLMATLNTIRAILKDANMREQGAIIQKEVGLLLKDVGNLSQRISKLDSHYHQGLEDLRLIHISLDKIIKRANNIEEIEINDYIGSTSLEEAQKLSLKIAS